MMLRAMEADNGPTVLYSVQEAAAKLRVAPKWLYERTRKNAIPYRRLGKYVRFSESDLEAIINGAKVPVNTSITGICCNISGNGQNYQALTGSIDAASPDRSRPPQKIQAEMLSSRHHDG
jgi:excisionase family DNA binding protein